MPFDSIQIRFKNVKEWPSPLANTRVVPFVNSYFEVIKSCIEDIRTEYFWVFPSFMSMKQIDFDFIPEQFEKNQIHVWYSGHPKAGYNKEGNVLLIPTKEPVEPSPTLAVEIPIKFSDNGDAYSVCSLVNVNVIVPSVETPRAVPSLVL